LVSAGLKVIILFGLFIASLLAIAPDNFPRVTAFLGVIILVPLLAVVALEIAAGVLSLLRRKWGWALAGSIVAILPFSFLGLTATILVALSRNEFE
jgi:hypothetical protein